MVTNLLLLLICLWTQPLYKFLVNTLWKTLLIDLISWNCVLFNCLLLWSHGRKYSRILLLRYLSLFFKKLIDILNLDWLWILLSLHLLLLLLVDSPIAILSIHSSIWIILWYQIYSHTFSWSLVLSIILLLFLSICNISAIWGRFLILNAWTTPVIIQLSSHNALIKLIWRWKYLICSWELWICSHRLYIVAVIVISWVSSQLCACQGIW